jgi:two-component system, OmpR family, sensor kinase
MPPAGERKPSTRDCHRLLSTLEQLLAVDATEIDVALTRCSDLVGHALGAGKVDIFLYDAADDALVVKNASDAPLGRLQLSVGLGTQALSGGGRMVRVFETGEPWFSSHITQDPEELANVTDALGIRSTIAVPLIVDDTRRGVVAASSDQPGFFSHDDLTFLEAVSHWIGLILHRTELAE